MKPIEPCWGHGDLGKPLPSKTAVCISQSIDWDMSGKVTCSQMWREQNGEEWDMSLDMNPDMKSGIITSCSVTAPGPGSSSASGIWCPPTKWLKGAPPRVSACSGLLMNVPVKPRSQNKKLDEILQVQEALPGLEGEDKVEGMDYDFTDTGLMNKRKKLDRNKRGSRKGGRS